MRYKILLFGATLLFVIGIGASAIYYQDLQKTKDAFYDLYEEICKIEDVSEVKYVQIMDKIFASNAENVYKDLAIIRFINQSLNSKKNIEEKTLISEKTALISSQYLRDMANYTVSSFYLSQGDLKMAKKYLDFIGNIKNSLLYDLINVLTLDIEIRENGYSYNKIQSKIDNLLKENDLPEFIINTLKNMSKLY